MNIKTEINKYIYGRRPTIILAKEVEDSGTYRNFVNHDERFQPVLNQLVEQESYNCSKKDLWTLVEGDPTRRDFVEENMTFWREKESVFSYISNMTSWRGRESYVSNNRVASNHLENIKTRLINDSGFSEWREAMLHIDNREGMPEAVRLGREHARNVEMLPDIEDINILLTNLFSRLTKQELSFVLDFSTIDEKYVLLVLQPIIMGALGYYMGIQWSMAFTSPGNFNTIIKKLAGEIFVRLDTEKKPSFTCFHTYKKLCGFVSVGCVGSTLSFYLYSNIFNKQYLLSPLYSGLEGPLATYLGTFRDVGSRLIFESTRMISTFSNAALAGFLEPKQQALKNILENIKRR